jgi:hypothetical protein
MADLSLAKLIGIAMIVLAITGPLSYCAAINEIERTKREADIRSLQRACIEAKGEWYIGWTIPRCILPPVSKGEGNG